MPPPPPPPPPPPAAAANMSGTVCVRAYVCVCVRMCAFAGIQYDVVHSPSCGRSLAPEKCFSAGSTRRVPATT